MIKPCVRIICAKKCSSRKGFSRRFLTAEKLYSHDHEIIDAYCDRNCKTQEWSIIRCNLRDASSDETFLTIWRDEFTLKHVFESGLFRTTVSNDGQDQDPQNTAGIEMHNIILQRLCAGQHPIQRLTILQQRYQHLHHSEPASLQTIKVLISYIALVQQGKWNEVAKKINAPQSRDLMMAAMHSLRDVNSIQKALSRSDIRYSLDSNTLTYFAVQHKRIAKIVLKQTLWQRLSVWFLNRFTTGRFLTVPAKRLYSDHIARISMKHPRLCQTRLKAHSHFYYAVTGHEDLRGKITRDQLSTFCTAVSKEVAKKTVFKDRELWSKFVSPANSREQTHDKLRLLATLGFSYSDKNLIKYPGLFDFGFDVTENVAANDQASDRGNRRFSFCAIFTFM